MAKNKLIKRRRGRPQLRHGGYSFMKSGKIPADKPEIDRYLTWVRLRYIEDLGPEEKDLTAGQTILLNKLITLEGLTRCIEVMAAREEKVMLPQRYMSYVNTILKLCQTLGIKRVAQERVPTAAEMTEIIRAEAKEVEGGR